MMRKLRMLANLNSSICSLFTIKSALHKKEEIYDHTGKTNVNTEILSHLLSKLRENF